MQSARGFTIADMETFPDPLDDTRYELIAGELFVAHQPHWEHQLSGNLLLIELMLWNRASGLGVANTAPGLIFSDADNVAPDLVWISHARLAHGLADGKLHVAPELVVEVLSPGIANERRDREAKLKLYAATGVDEYWILDWRSHQIELFRRNGERLVFAGSLTDGETLSSPLLPGFFVPVADLWSAS